MKKLALLAAAASLVGFTRFFGDDPAADAFATQFPNGLPQTGIYEIPLSLIRANPVALRDVNQESQEFIELKDSVKQYGVLSSVSVRYRPGEDGKSYELIDGLQRYTSSLLAGSGVAGKVGVIPAQILTKNDEDTLIAQIIGNAQRVKTLPVEYAHGIMKILATHPTTTEAELAATLNKSPQWINLQLGLLKLNDAAKILVNEGKIAVATAYVLAKLPSEEQTAWLERAQTMSVQEISGQMTARAKQIRDDNRKGKDAGEEQFQAVAHLRKKDELEKEIDAPEVGPALIQKVNALDGLPVSKAGLNQAAAVGFQLGLLYAINKDPVSVDQQKAKWEARKKTEAEQKIRRDAEKKQKRAEELKAKEKQAAIDAEAAQKAAAALPAAV